VPGATMPLGSLSWLLPSLIHPSLHTTRLGAHHHERPHTLAQHLKRLAAADADAARCARHRDLATAADSAAERPQVARPQPGSNRAPERSELDHRR